MLWIALRLPQLALETLSRGHVPRDAGGVPWAIVEDRRVLACDAQAASLGVRTAMKLAAAWALAPRLRVHERDRSAERTALEGVAAWVGRFTPMVSLEPPQGVLMEVQGSLRRFGGLEALVSRIRDGVAALGFGVRLAAAPSARGAWLLTFAETETLCCDFAVLRSALARLPIEALELEDEGDALLERIGVTQLRQLLDLPRAGLARRLGPELLEQLDRALGQRPEPRRFYAPPERFAERLELPAEVEHAEGLLFAARRLLLQLEGLLIARQSGIRGFCVLLEHRSGAATRVEVGLASPSCEVERFVALLRERLASCVLAAPVEAIRIEADAFVALGGRTLGLFGDAQESAEAWHRLVERLQARLGRDAVVGLGLNADHRPEHAAVLLPADAQGRSAEAPALGPRPLWLIEPPRVLEERNGMPCENGPLLLCSGPERIESGWWDGAGIARDYFIARSADAALLWIYREPGGRWYLHGLFS